MEDLLQTIRDQKTKAKNRRDRGQYESATEILKGTKGVIPLIQKELSSTELADLKMQLASELADCYGILGGIFRRWALESKTEQDRKSYLEKSVEAYQKGYEAEQNPEYKIVNSYNMVNRLVSYILLQPGCLEKTSPPGKANEDIIYNVDEELQTAKNLIQEQLKEKRRGDIWALADLALVRLLLSHYEPVDPMTVYADFNAKAPPDYAYESTLSTLRPLAELKVPVANSLREAVKLLENKLGQLRS